MSNLFFWCTINNIQKVLEIHFITHSFKHVFFNYLKFIQNYKIKKIIKYDVRLKNIFFNKFQLIKMCSKECDK